MIDRRRTKPRKYSYDALLTLQKVWSVAGGICGKYLAVSMSDWLDAMEAEGSLIPGQGRYSPEVRSELEQMSPATIDRYLTPARAKDPIRGKTTTKPGSLLRNSITIRKAGDEVETEPGFFEIDTVAHCGPTLKGEFARTVNYTDVHTGWVFTRAIRNNAAIHVQASSTPSSTRSRSWSPVSTATTEASSSTTTSSAGLPNETSTSPAPALTRRTTKPPSSRRTTTSCAATASTTATTHRSSSSC
ncbi:MAG: hypothetical protein R2722_12200 [Tessaracoccus sp.]